MNRKSVEVKTIGFIVFSVVCVEVNGGAKCGQTAGSMGGGKVQNSNRNFSLKQKS